MEQIKRYVELSLEAGMDLPLVRDVKKLFPEFPFVITVRENMRVFRNQVVIEDENHQQYILTITKVKKGEVSEMRHTIKMVLERETKGAIRYKEVASDGGSVSQANAVVGTLYIRKTALGGEIPKTLTVTLEG